MFSVTPGIRHQLYTKFKEDNVDTWQEILKLHDMIESGQFLPQTIAQYAQTFSKLKKRVVSVVHTTTLLSVLSD
jgi:capsule polysaccharide modification protein KpsS